MATISYDHSKLLKAVTALDQANSLTSSGTPREHSDSVRPGGVDSGYASQSSTPDSSKSTFVDQTVSSGKNIWPRKPKKLQPFEKPIPKLTWDRFSDLREQYAERLNEFTRDLPGYPSILMTLQVLGENAATAEPWVFVQCDKAILRKLNNFFKEPYIKMDFEPPEPTDRSPRLRVVVCPRKPRELARREESLVQPERLAHGDLIEIFGRAILYSDSLCGTQIMSAPSLEGRQATMGGIILVTDKEGHENLFGITASHFLDDDRNEFDDDLDDDFYVEESFEVDLDMAEDENPFAILEDSDFIEPTISDWSKVGKLSEASHNFLDGGRNLDWALVTIEDRSFSLPNKGDPFLNPTRECDFNGPINVRMLTTRGIVEGVLSGTWSYIMLPPGKVLVRTQVLSISDATSLQAGDSGSWVLDSVTRQVYGYIVASDVFGRGYVVPLWDAFEDIQHRLSAKSVALPSLEDFCRFNKRFTELENEGPAIHQSDMIVDPASPMATSLSRRSSLPSQQTTFKYLEGYNNAINLPKKQAHRPTDSGYSSMNTTPGQSPSASPPQQVTPQGPRDHELQHRITMANRSIASRTSIEVEPRGSRFHGWLKNVK